MKIYLVMYRWNDYDGSDKEDSVWSSRELAEARVAELEPEDMSSYRCRLLDELNYLYEHTEGEILASGYRFNQLKVNCNGNFDSRNGWSIAKAKERQLVKHHCGDDFSGWEYPVTPRQLYKWHAQERWDIIEVELDSVIK